MLLRSLARGFKKLDTLIQNKQWTLAVEEIEKLSGVPSEVDKTSLYSLLWGVSNSGKCSEAYKLLMQFPSLEQEPDELAYTAVIESCLRYGKTTLAMNLFYQCQIFGVPLDLGVYNELLNKLVKKTGIRNIKWLVSCMQKDQLAPSLQVCISLIKLAFMHKEFALAQQVLLTMNQTGYEMPSSLIQNFLKRNTSKSKEYLELEETWQRISEDLEMEDVLFEAEFDVEKSGKEAQFKERGKLPLSFQVILFPPEKQLRDEESEQAFEDSDDDSD